MMSTDQKIKDAWDNEEAWRSAVREVFGPEGYAKTQVVAARIRAENNQRSYDACAHVMEAQALYGGAMCCRKCGMGVLRGA